MGSILHFPVPTYLSAMCAVYEPTPHHFGPLGSSKHTTSSTTCICGRGAGGDRFGTSPLCNGEGSLHDPGCKVERVDLWPGSGDSAFLLRNLLSPEECDDLIAQAESFGLSCCGYHQSIRVTDRVSVMGADLGKLLFERARPYLLDVFVPGLCRGPKGAPESLLKGLWQPCGLNPCFRACRYSPGGFFAPHYDGGFDYSDRHRSIKTFMLYLNDGFSGGDTTFYNDYQQRYKAGLKKNVIYSLRPEKGSCLVFNHCITHDGAELLGGNKYILRSEVMYHLVSAFDIGVQQETGSDSDSDDFIPIDESLM